jgi:LDH2 family malate/lactate/ureidoglycolate dehydrogenase
MGQLIDQIKSSRLAPGSSGIFLPGEIEANSKATRSESGIPMTAGVMDGLERVASEMGVSERLQGV